MKIEQLTICTTGGVHSNSLWAQYTMLVEAFPT